MNGIFAVERISVSVMVVLAVAALSGCASPIKTTEHNLSNPAQLVVILPDDNDVNAKIFTGLSFLPSKCYYSYKDNSTTRKVLRAVNTNARSSSEGQAELSFNFINNKDGKSIVAACGGDKFGIHYHVNYSIEKIENGTVMKFRPVSYKSYAEEDDSWTLKIGLTESGVIDRIVSQKVELKLEIDSPYKPEPVYANFKRLAREAEQRRGAVSSKSELEGDFYLFSQFIAKTYGTRVVDGKTYTVSTEGLLFNVKVMPYQDGSKAVISMKVPGGFTSEDRDTVDFILIINEIKSLLAGIVKS